MPGINLPSGITIHRAEPEINLPSSITISRVEPEIQIVEENIVQVPPNRQMHVPQQMSKALPVLSPQRPIVSRGGRVMMGRGSRGGMSGPRGGRGPGRPTVMSRGSMMGLPSGGSRGMGSGLTQRSPQGSMQGMRSGRGGSAAVSPMQLAAVGSLSNGLGLNSMQGMAGGMVARPRATAGMMPTPRGMQLQGMHGVNPLKRPLAPAGRPMAGMPPMKRPRMPAGQFVGGVSGTQPYNTAGAINPGSLAPFDRLCRICGAPNAVIFRLQDKTEVMERVDTILGLKINLKEDAAAGYPSVVCRKCCNLIDTFYHFSNQVKSGQEELKKKVEERRKRQEAAQEITTEDNLISAHSPGSPGSIGVDPLDAILPDQSSLIIPDADTNTPDTTVGKIKIKQESLKTLKASSHMTTVFTDSVDVKIKTEPGTVDTGGDSDTEQAAAAATGGSLFDDYPSLVPPEDEATGTSAAATTDSGALFENYSTAETEMTSHGEGGHEQGGTTLETPPPPPELEGEELLRRPVINAVRGAVADGVSEPAENRAVGGDSTGSSEVKELTGTVPLSDGEGCRQVVEESGGNGGNKQPEAATAAGTVEGGAGGEGDGGVGEGEEAGDQAGPWSTAEKDDEGSWHGEHHHQQQQQQEAVGEGAGDKADSYYDDEYYSEAAEDGFMPGEEEEQEGEGDGGDGGGVRAEDHAEDQQPRPHAQVDGGDPLLEMEAPEDNGVDRSDDFGGYDPLKLIQMTAATTVEEVDEEEEEGQDLDDYDADDGVEDDVDHHDEEFSSELADEGGVHYREVGEEDNTLEDSKEDETTEEDRGAASGEQMDEDGEIPSEDVDESEEHLPAGERQQHEGEEELKDLEEDIQGDDGDNREEEAEEGISHPGGVQQHEEEDEEEASNQASVSDTGECGYTAYSETNQTAEADETTDGGNYEMNEEEEMMMEDEDGYQEMEEEEEAYENPGHLDHTGDEEEEEGEVQQQQQAGTSGHEYTGAEEGDSNNHNADGDEDEYTGYQQDTQDFGY